MKALLAIFVLVGITSHSEARVACAANSTSCFFVNMPLYNQNDSSLGSTLLPNGPSKSMLCGPTSAAMSLQGVVNEVAAPTNVRSTSWTATTFLPTEGASFKDTQKKQIEVMNTKVKGSAVNGTSSSSIGLGVYSRAADFTSAAGGANTGYPVSYPNSNYVNYIKIDKSATTILFGHYTRKSTTSNGKTYYSYTRNGGHFVTINGYSNDSLLIYNPWYAKKEERKITVVPKGCNETTCENLPGGLSQRSLLYVSGSSYKFIDHHTRLWAE